MASDRRAFKSSSGISFGSVLADATSSVSAADADGFSWQAKGRGLEQRSTGLETGSDFKAFRIETSLLSYRCQHLVCMCLLLSSLHVNGIAKCRNSFLKLHPDGHYANKLYLNSAKMKYLQTLYIKEIILGVI